MLAFSHCRLAHSWPITQIQIGNGAYRGSRKPTVERAYQEPGLGPKSTVKVAEQRDFSSVVYLLVQQDGHDLTRGPAPPRWLGRGSSRSVSFADVNQAVTGRRLFSQSAKTSSAVPCTGRSGKLRRPGPKACSI